jgi:GNAT superfamily N-acetyltransferase
MTVVVRRADRLDVPFMRSLLSFAYNWHVAQFDTHVPISKYVDGWGRRGDTSLIAMDDGHSVGAAWFRLFPEERPGFAFIDDETPEMTIVVVPTKQDLGIGEQLLDALVARAKADGYKAVSASVKRGDADAGRFSSRGFEEVRAEGETLTLRRQL